MVTQPQYAKPILVTTIYRLPDSLVEMFDRIDGLLCTIEFESKESIIAGDMNCNLMKVGDNDTKHIKHICNFFGHTQLNENATQTTVDTITLIDHLAATKPINISDKSVIPCGISDKLMLSFLLEACTYLESRNILKLEKLENSKTMRIIYF